MAGEMEKVLTAHHPEPWLPSTDDEVLVYGSGRVRMSCPVKGEDLFHRYRKVLAGLKGIRFTDDEFLESFNFEHALADMTACEHCGVTCRTVFGHSHYFDLDRKRTAKEGKPFFKVYPCPGAGQRLTMLRELFLGRVVYEAEPAVVQQTLTTESASQRTDKKGVAASA